MIGQILLFVIGTLLVFFIPGYLATVLFLPKFSMTEKIFLGIGLSIIIDVGFAFFLTFIGKIFGMVALTTSSAFVSLISISVLFAVVILIRPNRGE